VPLILFIPATLFIVLLGPAAAPASSTRSPATKGGPKKVTVVVHDSAQGDEMQDPDPDHRAVHGQGQAGHARRNNCRRPRLRRSAGQANRRPARRRQGRCADARLDAKLFVERSSRSERPIPPEDPVLLQQTSEPVIAEEMQVTVIPQNLGRAKSGFIHCQTSAPRSWRREPISTSSGPAGGRAVILALQAPGGLKPAIRGQPRP